MREEHLFPVMIRHSISSFFSSVEHTVLLVIPLNFIEVEPVQLK